MLFAPRASTKPLTEFLRRLGISLEAGIDVRKALANEARRAAPGLRQRVEQMSDAANRGDTLSAALEQTGDYFPLLVREVIHIGEQTGHLPEVLKQLVVHYESQLALRRSFMTAIAWPALELITSLFAVGFLIWISGMLTGINGNKADILGFGLTGDVGLAIYLAFLAAVATGLYLCYRAALAGKLWVAPMQRAVLKLPLIGTAFRDLAIARFAWTLHLTMGAAIDVKHAVSLSLRSTHNVEFTDQDQFCHDMIQRGESIYETLSGTGIFPIELLQAVQVGEESGRLVETMEIVARQQMDSARRALALLTSIAGYLVWALVAALIIALIFHLAGSYVNTINGLANPPHR